MEEAGKEEEDKEDLWGEMKCAQEVEMQPADAEDVDEATDTAVEQVDATAEEDSAVDEKVEALAHEEELDGQVDAQESSDATEKPATAGERSMSADNGDGLHLGEVGKFALNAVTERGLQIGEAVSGNGWWSRRTMRLMMAS